MTTKYIEFLSHFVVFRRENPIVAGIYHRPGVAVPLSPEREILKNETNIDVICIKLSIYETMKTSALKD